MDNSEDTEIADSSEKLIPEWSRNADDQVLLAGIAVVAIFFGILGWSALTGDDDEETTAPAVAAVDSELVDPETGDGVTSQLNDVDVTGEVQTAVQDLPGTITGVGTGSAAVLEGFVANAGERSEAETAALTVSGIDSVDNRLELLEPSVLTALEAEGVDSPSAKGEGSVITIGGIVDSEEQRETVVASAADVPGVTQVIDQLTIPVQSEPEEAEEEVEEPEEAEVEEQVSDIANQLNVLPQVQFDYSSTTITASSFGELDQAVELLSQIDESYDGTVEVQGYTDTTGNAETNQRLSEGRAQAVLDYLVSKGIPETLLVSKGYGPTTEFGPELEDNRLVRFEPAG